MLSVCKVNQSVPDNTINLIISSARCVYIYEKKPIPYGTGFCIVCLE